MLFLFASCSFTVIHVRYNAVQLINKQLHLYTDRITCIYVENVNVYSRRRRLF